MCPIEPRDPAQAQAGEFQPIIFCKNCGCYSAIKAQKIRANCEMPEDPGLRRNREGVIKKLMEGRHPRYNYFVGKLHPVNLIDEWRATQAYCVPPGQDDNAGDAEGASAGPSAVPAALEFNPMQIRPPTATTPPAARIINDAGRWSIADVKRARAGNQQVFSDLADFQAEVDEMNKWTTLYAHLVSGRIPAASATAPPPPPPPCGSRVPLVGEGAVDADAALLVDLEELNAGLLP